MAETVARRLADAALELLESLEPSRRALVHLPFDHAERRSWAYTPQRRPGMPLAQMGREEAKATHRLVAAGLRLPAYARVAAIMGLEDVLDEIEGRRRRHAGDYWVVVFGDPGGDEPWGCRFEGHHVSVNHTVADGEVASTPLFLGANPARVRDGDVTLLRPLAREEDLGFSLVASLDQRRRARAVFSDEAPPDIVTGEQTDVAAGLEPRGVAGADLSGEAGDLLRALVATFLERLPDEVARPRLTDLDRHGWDDVHFAWAGGIEPGSRYYYRLQAPRFLVEVDNTDESANHLHTVLRDPDDDFGRDLLGAHRAVDHPGAGQPR